MKIGYYQVEFPQKKYKYMLKINFKNVNENFGGISTKNLGYDKER